MGTRFHLHGEWGNLTAALADAGLPEEIAEVAESTAYDEAIRSSHARAVALAGGDVGTPVRPSPGLVANGWASSGRSSPQLPPGRAPGSCGTAF